MTRNHRFIQPSPENDLPNLDAYRGIDPHFHTPASDGVSPIRDLRDAALSRDLLLGITDHNRIGGAEEAFEQYGGEEWALPGIELTLRSRVHILIYFERIEGLADFWDEHLSRRSGFSATTPLKLRFEELEEILGETEGTFTVAPHPYAVARNGLMTARKRYAHLSEKIEAVDAIEIFNGQELPVANRRAEELAFSMNAPFTGGSDGHHAREMGTAITFFPPEMTFFEAVREQAVVVAIREGNPFFRLAGHGYKVPYHLKKGVRYLALLWKRIATKPRHPDA